jgi:predicted nucleic acid-binding protein
MGGGRAYVPQIWKLEVANVLLVKKRRRQIDARFADDCLGLLRELPIEVDSSTDPQAWTHTLALAREHGLTTYDACYLELAERMHLPLASLDGALNRAALARGVRLIRLDAPTTPQ